MFGESIKRRKKKGNEMKAMASHENFRWRWRWSIVGKGMEILNSFLEVSIDKLREWER